MCSLATLCWYSHPHRPRVSPPQKPKSEKVYDEDDKEFLKKKKEEEAAMKKAREALLKGKKK